MAPVIGAYRHTQVWGAPANDLYKFLQYQSGQYGWRQSLAHTDTHKHTHTRKQQISSNKVAAFFFSYIFYAQNLVQQGGSNFCPDGSGENAKSQLKRRKTEGKMSVECCRQEMCVCVCGRERERERERETKTRACMHAHKKTKMPLGRWLS